MKAARNSVTLTRDLAFASGQDAANAQMRAAGRTRWNAEDRAVATSKTNRLLLYVPVEHGGLDGIAHRLSLAQLDDLGLTEADVRRAVP